MDTVYTTGELARWLHAADRTIQLWCDRGHIRAFRLPGTRHRRIPHLALMEFLHKHQYPLEVLEDTMEGRAVAAAARRYQADQAAKAV